LVWESDPSQWHYQSKLFFSQNQKIPVDTRTGTAWKVPIQVGTPGTKWPDDFFMWMPNFNGISGNGFKIPQTKF
jgi:hypothetical protein